MRSTTWQDAVTALQGNGIPRRPAPKVLQGLVWLDHVLHLSGLPLEEFVHEYAPHLEFTGLPGKWRTGKVTASPHSVSEIAKQLPGSDEMYSLPLYQLLLNKPISLKRIKRLLSQYQSGSDFFPWRFPNDDELRAEHRLSYSTIRSDSDSLFARGDLYGFVAIIGLVREAEALGDADMQCYHCANMYRALPAVLRLSWFRPHAELLRQCLLKIHARIWVSWAAFEVDWDVIRRQVEAPEHETIRERRPRDPKTLRFNKIEDPIRFHERGTLPPGYPTISTNSDPPLNF